MKIAIIYNLPQELSHKKDALADEEAYFTAKAIKEVLEDENNVDIIRFKEDSIKKLKNYDVVFNLSENTAGCPLKEDEIAEMMEDAGIIFTGASSRGLKACVDKELTKKMLQLRKIPTPNFQIFTKADEKVLSGLNYPLIVKPSREDGSIGIDKNSVVYDEPGLRKNIKFILEKYNEPALAEEYIDGREINAAVLDGEILPLSEIMFELPANKPKILTYDAKWNTESDEYKKTIGKCPIEINPNIEKQIKKIAFEAFNIMGCRDYARVDFRVRGDIPYVLEVNPNPCINPDGTGFIRSAKELGYDYRELIKRIVNSAMKRKIKNKSKPLIEIKN